MYTTLYTLLSAVKTDSYPGNIPQEVNPPFINYHTFGTNPSNTKSGHSTVDFISLYVDCYAETLEEALTIAGNVRTALDYYSDTTITSITFRNQTDDFGFDSELHMIRQEYLIREKR